MNYDMQGHVCVVTGATGGIGGASARGLAARGAHVVLLVRSRERGEALRQVIARETPGAATTLVVADLALQREVRRAAAEIARAFPAIHVLVNNAAVYTRRRELTEEGIERQWAVNHLAPFLLTGLLRESLAAGAPARVVTVSSNAHRSARLVWDDLEMGTRRYLGFRQYANTKLANLLFTRELARRLAGTGITANALHPGVVATELLLGGFAPLRLFRRWMRTPEQGADTVLYLAEAPDVGGVTGCYFMDRAEIEPAPAALDDAAAKRLWTVSEAQVRPA